MPNVLFVALDQMQCLEWLVTWVAARPGSVSVAEAAHLQEAAARGLPPLVIAPSSELPSLSTVMPTLLERQCDVALTAIFVHLATPEYGLIIQEWHPVDQTFSQRRCSLAHLQREIDLVLGRWQVPAQLGEKVRGIGFYDCVSLDGQTLHVQTEVAGRQEPCIRCTVHRDGTILSSFTVPWPPGLQEREAAELLVRKQHDRTLSRARNGQYS